MCYASVAYIQRLLDMGLDVNRLALGKPLLHHAMACGRADVVSLLSSYGARLRAATPTPAVAVASTPHDQVGSGHKPCTRQSAGNGVNPRGCVCVHHAICIALLQILLARMPRWAAAVAIIHDLGTCVPTLSASN